MEIYSDSTLDFHPMSATVSEGLRERKKRETREAIARTAMKLFAARGFDAVTVADVAEAAGVSEKTVFNYFPAKEDLVLHRGAERLETLIEAIRGRPAGVSLVEPFRDVTMRFIDQVDRGSIEAILAVPRLVADSKSLRDRLFLAWEQEAAVLTPVIVEQARAAEDDLVAAVVARTLAWTHRVVFRAALRRLIAGDDQRAVAADLREEANRAYDLLERGLAGYGLPPG
jgi:AcrR family transcriptional regulator